jgi:hypothetical protein
VGGATYTPTATASSGLTVAITVDASASAVCSISAGVVSFQSVGTCVVDFDQAGNADYSAAPEVQQSFAVGQGAQTVSFTSTAPTGATIDGATYTPTATATSGLTVAITVDASASAVCAISSGVVSFTGVGTCVLDANQAGNTDYLAAPQVQQSFAVAGVVPGAPTIGTAVAADTSATVTWTAPSFTGGEALTGYVITPYIGTTAQATVSTGVVTSFVVTGLTNGVTYTFTVSATNAVGTGAPSAHTNTATPPVAQVPGPYTALAPVRICDTRSGNPSDLTGTAAQCNGTANAGTRLVAGTPLTIDVAGSFGVPSNATAVVVNVTGVNPSPAGYLSIYPNGAPVPTASNLNVAANIRVANLVETAVGVSGKVSLISNVSMDVVVDLEGYVSPTGLGGAGLYNPLATPARICDTRAGNPSGLSGGAAQCNGTANAGERLTAGGVLPVTVTGNGGVPATGVSAVVLNVTVVNPAAAGYLTAYPQGTTAPTASNINYQPGETLPNRIIVPVSATGQIDITANQATDVLVDVSGWYTSAGGTGTEYTTGAAPVRICDTRAGNPSGLTGAEAQCNGTADAGDPIGAGSTLIVNVTGLAGVPTGATAVVLNVTAVKPSAQTHLTVFPSGTPPVVSDLNPAAGAVEANLVVAKVSNSGTVSIYNFTGSTNVVVDVEGWYQATT